MATVADPKWIIEKDTFTENEKKLGSILTSKNIEYKVVKYVPFEDGIYDFFKDDDCVVFYGSLNLGSQLQREKKWIPGVYCDFQKLECSSYYNYFGKYLLNNNYIFMPLSEYFRQQDFVFKIFGVNNEIYCRPNSGRKQFTGAVVGKKSTIEDFGYSYYHENKELMLVISSPKEIQKEWRVVIANKKAITGSQYKLNRELEVSPDCPSEVLTFAEEMANTDWQPDVIYVMDICENNGELYLLELNSFSCSGLYDCNLEKIVDNVNKLAIDEWKENCE